MMMSQWRHGTMQTHPKEEEVVGEEEVETMLVKLLRIWLSKRLQRVGLRAKQAPMETLERRWIVRVPRPRPMPSLAEINKWPPGPPTMR